MKKIKIADLIPIEQYDKEMNWTPEEWAEIEKGAMRIIKRMELKEKRAKEKISQEALAKKAKLPRSTIARIEAGKGNPQINTLKQIAEALNMDLKIEFVTKSQI